MPTETKTALPRTLELALLFTGLCWLGAASITAEHAASGLALRMNLVLVAPLLEAMFLLFLLLFGYAALNWIGRRNGSVRDANALPKRSTVRQEWAKGAAIGWGALLGTLVLPMLTGSFYPQFWWRPQAWLAALLALMTMFVATLAVEVAFRGYLLKRAIAALGTTGGSLLMAAVFAMVANSRPNASVLSLVVAFVAGLLLALAYLRTHALWLGWGMHFAWSAATAVVFGMPVSGVVVFNGVVDTESWGRAWWSGGAYGPEGSLLALAALLLTAVVVYRATRDYAWNYTHPSIVAAGYPMNVPPPPAHTAMEQAGGAPPPPPLVQILSVTPAGASATPAAVSTVPAPGTRSSASEPTREES